MATLIRANGTTEEKNVKGLKDLQEAVGGLIEVAGVAPDGRTILCNEEGLLMNLPWNLTLLDWDIQVVGDVLLVNNKEFK